MTPRPIRRATLLAAVGLAVAAAPAVATEGPPGGAQPLPDPLAPVNLQPGPPAPAPAPAQTLRPRVMRASVIPRRVHAGHRSRLRVTLAAPGRLRVLVERRVGKHRTQVWVRTIVAPGRSVIVRLPGFRHAGRYRVTAIAVDAQGHRSRAVRRQLIVVRR
jgi:hypothetical protein